MQNKRLVIVLRDNSSLKPPMNAIVRLAVGNLNLNQYSPVQTTPEDLLLRSWVFYTGPNLPIPRDQLCIYDATSSLTTSWKTERKKERKRKKEKEKVGVLVFTVACGCVWGCVCFSLIEHITKLSPCQKIMLPFSKH